MRLAAGAAATTWRQYLRQHLLPLLTMHPSARRLATSAASSAAALPPRPSLPPPAAALSLLAARRSTTITTTTLLAAAKTATTATTTTTTTRRTAASSAAAEAAAVEEEEQQQLAAPSPSPPPPPPPRRSRSRAGARSRASPSSSSSSARRASADAPRPPTDEVRQWMEASLASLRSPAAQRLRPFVDPTNDELGLLPYPSQRPRGVLLEGLVRRFRRDQGPRLLLVKCGDFYEAVGFDAVLLVEHLALNPMGSTAEHRAPRAGFPKANLRAMLRRLTDEAGMAVAVYEETRDFDAAGRKARVLGGVVSPSQPEYVFGLASSPSLSSSSSSSSAGSGSSSPASESLASSRARPLLGASLNARGCTLFRLDVVGVAPEAAGAAGAAGAAVAATAAEGKSASSVVQPVLTVTENMTEEALWAAINETSLAPPFFLHTGGAGSGGSGSASSTAASTAATALASAQRWQRRVAEVLDRHQGQGGRNSSSSSFSTSQAGLVRRYEHPDALVGFELLARRALGLSPDEAIAVRIGGNGNGSNPQLIDSPHAEPCPPFMSTARQLGLAPAAEGVPSLLDAALPASAPRPCRDFVRRLLLRPPPPVVADGVRAAVVALLRGDAPLPDFRGAGGTVAASSSSSAAAAAFDADADGGGASSSLLPAPRARSFSANVSPTKLMTLLRAREAGADALRSLSAMLGRVAAALAAPELKPLVEGLLPVVARETGVDGALTAALLAQGCASAIESIARVVPGVPDEDNDPDRAASASFEAARTATVAAVERAFAEVLGGGAIKGLAERSRASVAGRGGRGRRSSTATEDDEGSATDNDDGSASPSPQHPATLPDGLLAMALAREAPVLARVRGGLMKEEMRAVAAARLAVARALAEGAAEAEAEAAAAGSAANSRPWGVASEYDDLNASVWLAVVERQQQAASAATGGRGKGNGGSSSLSSPAAAASAAIKHLSSRRADVFRAPIDRNGRGVRARHHFTTDALDAALAQYRRALERAEAAADARLRACSAELEREGLALVAACHFSVAALALGYHAAHAGTARGWAVPEPLLLLTPATTPTPVLLRPDGPIRLRGLWPYWMDSPGPGRKTVPNDVCLDGIMALTGPNMAGKSTVLRSVASACLLANAGLLVPCAAADVPPLRLFALRSFSGDAPAEGKSAFAVECEDTAYTLGALELEEELPPLSPSASSSSGGGGGAKRHNAPAPPSTRALVLIDELGKGTEVRKGTALAAAVLERLSRAPGCKGVFATHLHALRTLVPATTGSRDGGGGGGTSGGGGLSHWHMEVGPVTTREEEEEGGGGADPAASSPLPLPPRRAPTWRLKHGWCDESLAFEVAAEAGMPAGVVGRAAELLPLVDGALARRAAEGKAVVGSAVAKVEEERAAAEDNAAASPPRTPPAPAPAPPPVPSSFHVPASSIDDGAALLAAAARDVLPRFAAPSSSSSPSPPSVVVVRRGMAPPPAHAASSPVVYVVRWADGWFYCGETERLAARLQEHRNRRRKDAAGGGGDGGPGWLEAAYVPVGALSADGGGKGAARALEALAIRRMAEEGLPLWSDRDGR